MNKTGGPKRKAEYDVSPEQFIEAWQTSETAEEAAEKLGMPKPIVHARASGYRKKGIRLKSMPRVAPERGIDVERLNKLIEKIERAQRAQKK